ncbi:MAG: hypothetical protein ACYTGL_07655, partial [Planctomycetota bacterium]
IRNGFPLNQPRAQQNSPRNDSSVQTDRGNAARCRQLDSNCGREIDRRKGLSDWTPAISTLRRC